MPLQLRQLHHRRRFQQPHHLSPAHCSRLQRWFLLLQTASVCPFHNCSFKLAALFYGHFYVYSLPLPLSPQTILHHALGACVALTALLLKYTRRLAVQGAAVAIGGGTGAGGDAAGAAVKLLLI
jgi:hypothetical protein